MGRVHVAVDRIDDGLRCAEHRMPRNTRANAVFGKRHAQTNFGQQRRDLQRAARECQKMKGVGFFFAPNKWSKKEILGHLIDSVVNNLHRFTEVQFQANPYHLRGYNQEELVKANDYQNADIKEILGLFLQLNHRILKILAKQTPEMLAYEMVITDGTTVDLAFWIADYVEHAEHHLKQLRN